MVVEEKTACPHGALPTVYVFMPGPVMPRRLRSAHCDNNILDVMTSVKSAVRCPDRPVHW